MSGCTTLEDLVVSDSEEEEVTIVSISVSAPRAVLSQRTQNSSNENALPQNFARKNVQVVAKRPKQIIGTQPTGSQRRKTGIPKKTTSSTSGSRSTSASRVGTPGSARGQPISARPPTQQGQIRSQSSRNSTPNPSQPSTSGPSQQSSSRPVRGDSSRPRSVQKKRVPPGLKALKEIRYYQSGAGCSKLLIPRAAFQRWVKEILQKLRPGVDFRIQAAALEALQETTEEKLVNFFGNVNLCALHAKRVTIKKNDMALALRISGDSSMTPKYYFSGANSVYK